MSTVKLQSPADIPAIVDTFLGFTPSESLVVLGLGGGPTARVDIDPHTVRDAVAAMRSAAPHWANGVLVAVYSPVVGMEEVAAAFADLLPNVEVRVIVEVDVDDMVTDDEGNLHKPNRPDSLPARQVRPSRDSLVADAERVRTPASALATARQAYLDGDGARAWVYLDRFHALGGKDTGTASILSSFLTDAVDPKSPMVMVLLGH